MVRLGRREYPKYNKSNCNNFRRKKRIFTGGGFALYTRASAEKFPGGRPTEKQGRKIASLSLPLFYQDPVWNSKGGPVPPATDAHVCIKLFINLLVTVR